MDYDQLTCDEMFLLLQSSPSKLEILDFDVFYQLPDIHISEEIIVLQGDTSAPEDAMLFQFEETPQFGSNDEESPGWTSGNEIKTESITVSILSLIHI